MPGAGFVPLDPRFSLQLTSALPGDEETPPGRIESFPDGTSTGGRLRLGYGGGGYDVTVDRALGRAVLQ